MKKSNFGHNIASFWPNLKKWLYLTNLAPFFFSKDFQYIGRKKNVFSHEWWLSLYTVLPAPACSVSHFKALKVFTWFFVKFEIKNFNHFTWGAYLFFEGIRQTTWETYSEKKNGTFYLKKWAFDPKNTVLCFKGIIHPNDP